MFIQHENYLAVWESSLSRATRDTHNIVTYKLVISCGPWFRQSLASRFPVNMPFPPKLVWQCFWLRNGVDLVELSLHKTAFPNTLGTNCGVRRDKEIGVLKLAEDKTAVEYDTLVRNFSQTNLNNVSEP